MALPVVDYNTKRHNFSVICQWRYDRRYVRFGFNYSELLPMAPAVLFLVFTYLMGVSRGSLNCPTGKLNPLQFHLVRQCQRAAADEALALENTSSLKECADLAHDMRGLALNYAPGGPKRRLNAFDQRSFGKQGDKEQRIRSRLSVFEQPGEFFNCHVLKCPQNNTFSGMVNDSRFDYYSLYGRPTG